MRRREMRRGQKERSGNWRADYLETRTVGSPGGRREKGRESGTSPAAYPTWDIRSKTRTPCRVLCKAEALRRGGVERILQAEMVSICFSKGESQACQQEQAYHTVPGRVHLEVLVTGRARSGGVSSAFTPTRRERAAGLD